MGVVPVGIYAVYYQPAGISIGRLGVTLIILIFAALIWQFSDWGWLDPTSPSVLGWIALVVLATIMALRLQRLWLNRMANQNRLTCQNSRCLAPQHALEYHVDHIYPRSTHPELALKLENTRVLCARCNVERRNRTVGVEERPNPRLRRVA